MIIMIMQKNVNNDNVKNVNAPAGKAINKRVGSIKHKQINILYKINKLELSNKFYLPHIILMSKK
ncbi:hypothetical protein PFDG_05050 [Plasmodium falciparum Dd2]|uniref:Uncharacterized protein n=1 Tax=Plasmodium falciparum (isolate Dd2) TaxID=57267 RepID=A0A0L7M9K3_PLAF4|nr:hypothetical protein PFDG_05050 [Plasmodium falciparum Dd2]